MEEPTYDLLQIDTILNNCVKHSDLPSIKCLVDILIEDDKLYTDQEVDLMTILIMKTIKKIKK